MERTNEDLWQVTWTLVAALRRLGALYDDGEQWPAMSMATLVSTLVRTGKRGNTRALLEQIGVLSEMLFLSTGRPIAPNVKPDVPLLLVRVGPDGIRLIPRKDGPPDPECTKWLPFADWWNEPVFGDDNGQRLSREALARSLRDQDGGGHVDRVLTDAAYVLLKRGQVGVEIHQDGRQVPIEGAQHATMRQIAWELDQSIGRHLGPGPAPKPANS